MRIELRITRRIIQRCAVCHPGFWGTDGPLALSMKPLLPGISVVGDTAGFCDHNGREHTILIPFEARMFEKHFREASLEDRLNTDEVIFKVELPESLVAALGRVEIEELIAGATSLNTVNYPPTAEPMGWASRVNAPTNVDNLP